MTATILCETPVDAWKQAQDFAHSRFYKSITIVRPDGTPATLDELKALATSDLGTPEEVPA